MNKLLLGATLSLSVLACGSVGATSYKVFNNAGSYKFLSSMANFPSVNGGATSGLISVVPGNGKGVGRLDAGYGANSTCIYRGGTPAANATVNIIVDGGYNATTNPQCSGVKQPVVCCSYYKSAPTSF